MFSRSTRARDCTTRSVANPRECVKQPSACSAQPVGSGDIENQGWFRHRPLNVTDYVHVMTAYGEMVATAGGSSAMSRKAVGHTPTQTSQPALMGPSAVSEIHTGLYRLFRLCVNKQIVPDILRNPGCGESRVPYYRTAAQGIAGRLPS